MLTSEALRFLADKKYDAAAERRWCMIPMGGIYWADEIPDFHALLKIPEVDRKLVFRLFKIRFQIWDGKALDASDQEFWESTRQQLPDYPVFHRTILSTEDQAAQALAEEETIKGFEALFADADEVRVNGDGSFSATFDLTKEQPKPWWKQLLRRFR